MQIMDRETRILIEYFPSLADDPYFKITSPWSYDYNCIAWALGTDEKRFWPFVEDENGYTKIALYAIDGEITHAARQLDNGLWTSKLGPLNDIQHGNPEVIEGGFYGKVAVYMKKKKN